MLTMDPSTLRPLPDWATLQFAFNPADYMYLAETADRTWPTGAISPFHDLQVSPAAGVFNYGQALFEGLKALRTEAGKIVLFRPAENGRRFHRGAALLEMPPFPVPAFVAAVTELVQANARWVPPYSCGSLYLRPVMIGSGPVLGVHPAPSYTFYIFANPVGLYKPGEGRVMVLDAQHRAAPYGTGMIKASSNYAGTLRPQRIVEERHYKDVLYLDARTDRYIEELVSSNFFAILGDGTLVTPRLGSILPGITRDSVLTIARELLGWRVVERDLALQEVLDQAQEAFFTGTAAVVQPVTVINYQGTDYPVGTGQPGAGTELLRQTLLQIQTQGCDNPFGWVHEVADPNA